MKSLHQHFQIIGKSKGRSAVAAAAYRSASRLVEYILDKETGLITEQVWNYTKKGGVVFSAIFAPDGAPKWVYDRQQLWNKVNDSEMARKDGQLSREFDIALPIELTMEQNAELIADIAKSYVAYGMIADANMHYDNPNNPHGHIMLTMRDLVKFDTGNIDFGLKNRGWNKVSFLRRMREKEAYLINQHLAKHGHEIRVSHLSYKDRGIDLIPTVHVGSAGMRMVHSDRVRINKEIINENAKRIIANPDLIITKLSMDKSVFSATDIENEIHKVLVTGIEDAELTENNGVEDKAYSKEQLLVMYGIVRSSTNLAMINHCDLKSQTLFARSDRVEFEHKLEEVIKDLARGKNHKLNVTVKEIEKINVGVKLTQQQLEAVVSILNGNNLSVLEGFPGSGKSTVMKLVKKYYEANGYMVIGTAMANKACQELANKVGIDVINTTRLRAKWQKLRGFKAELNLDYNFYKRKEYNDWHGILPENTVLIADEAGSLDAPDICYLLNEINKSRGKAILLGDNNQNPAIGTKGAFLKAGEIAGRFVLTEVNRHKNPDEAIRDLHIEATCALGNYNIARAISIYEELDMFQISDNELSKKQNLVQVTVSQIIAYSKECGDLGALKRVAVGAYRNEEVNELNEAIRQRLKEAGIIKGEDHAFRSGSGDVVNLSVGDQIIFKSNKAKFDDFGGVDNNEIGIVSKIIEVDEYGYGQFEVKVRSGGEYRLVKIDTCDKLWPVKFKHGYALTNYALQGVNIEQKNFSIDKHSGYEVFNVGATRHEIDCKFFAARDTLEDEVFRTKDLDIQKVRAEFNAQAYRIDEEGKRWNVPLWQVGLRLLVAKRANLNLAGDYRYTRDKELIEKTIDLNQDTAHIRNSIKVARIKLMHSNYIIDAVLIENRPRIEDELRKYFPNLSSGFALDVRAIIQSVSRFKKELARRSIEDREIAQDKQKFAAKLHEHINTLKLSGIGGVEQEGINFEDLTSLDQNLILYLQFSKRDLKILRKEDICVKGQVRKIQINSAKLKVLEKKVQRVEEFNQITTCFKDAIEVARIKLMHNHYKIDEILIKSRIRIEDELRKYFPNLSSGFALDVRAIIQSVSKFKKELAHRSTEDREIAEDKQKFAAKLHEHISTLKLSGIGGVEQEGINFEDITSLDQNLILHLQFSKRELKVLRKESICAKRQVHKIQDNSAKLKVFEKKVRKVVAGSNKLLAGNLGAMREYIDTREKVIAIQKSVHELEAVLRKTAWQKLILKEVKDNFDLQLVRAPINAFSIVIANKIFAGKYFNKHRKEIDELKAENKKLKKKLEEPDLETQAKSLIYKNIKENRNKLREIFDVRWARHKHIAEIIGESMAKDELLDKDQQNQLIAHLMDSGKEGCKLNEKYINCVEITKDLASAKGERQAKAVVIVEYYGGFVDDLQDQVKMSKLISQMGYSFETIRKHAGVEVIKHYFNPLRYQRPTISNHSSFAEFLEIIATGAENTEFDKEDLIKLAEIHTELGEFITSTKESINIKTTARDLLVLEQAQIKFELDDFTKFKTERLPHYFSKIFKDDKNIVMAKLIEFCTEDPERAEFIDLVRKNPDLLGNLKPVGFLTRIFNKDEVEEVNLNLQVFEENIKRFVNGEDMVRIAKPKLDSGELACKIAELKKEIESLKLSLANEEEQLLLDEISYLKDYEGFEKIGIGKTLADLCKGENASNLLMEHNVIVQPKAELLNIEQIEQCDTKNDVEKYIKKGEKELKHGEIKSQGSTSRSNYKETRFDKPRLDFDEIKNAINSTLIERIFRQYAPLLNPDGKFDKKGSNKLSCGSIHINLKDGRWFRFSRGVGGDLISLVKEAEGVDTKRAFEIIGGYAGIMPKVSLNVLPKRQAEFEEIRHEPEKIDQWKVYDKVPNGVRAFNAAKDLAWFLEGNNLKLSNTYEYRNKDGELLGFVIRALDSEGDKQPRPVAYCYNPAKNRSCWQLKGFTDNGYKPIYGIEKLGQYSTKKVMIVEGEKTADAACKLFPEYSVISWMGGSGSADKADWKHLEGREVIIWPDNDEDGKGQKAAKMIYDAINKANGFRGLASVVDIAPLNLPKKWDLADEMPSHLNEQDLRAAIDKAWLIQVNYQTERDAIAKLTSQVSIALNKKELLDYMNYATAREKLDVAHDWLGSKDPLYKEMLIASVFSFLENNSGTERALRINELIEKTYENIPELASSVIEIYQSAQGNFYEYDIKLCEQFIEDNKMLLVLNPVKAELHECLMKDFSLLHVQQLGVKSLNRVHIEKLSQDLTKIIKNYDLSYKGRQRSMQDEDRREIAKVAHSTINTDLWWQELTKDEIAAKNTALEKQKAAFICDTISRTLDEANKAASLDQISSSSTESLTDFKGNRHQTKTDYLVAISRDEEIMCHIENEDIKAQIQSAVGENEILAQEREIEFKLFLRLHGGKLDDICKLNSKIDPEKLKQELKDMQGELRGDKIKSMWECSYREHIAPKLDHFDKLKCEAKTIQEHLNITKEQKAFATQIYSQYKELADQAGISCKDERIGHLLVTESIKPGFLDVIARDIDHGVSIGIWTNKEALEKLKAKEYIGDLTDELKVDCSKYHVNNIMEGLRHLDRFKTLTHDNIQFTSHKEYLEHHINNKTLSPYLQNTTVTDKLAKIYKHETHKLQQQKEQELALKQEKALEKEYGKGGFGL